jgi:hypothetical protein
VRGCAVGVEFECAFFCRGGNVCRVCWFVICLVAVAGGSMCFSYIRRCCFRLYAILLNIPFLCYFCFPPHPLTVFQVSCPCSSWFLSCLALHVSEDVHALVFSWHAFVPLIWLPPLSVYELCGACFVSLHSNSRFARVLGLGVCRGHNLVKFSRFAPWPAASAVGPS